MFYITLQLGEGRLPCRPCPRGTTGALVSRHAQTNENVAHGRVKSEVVNWFLTSPSLH